MHDLAPCDMILHSGVPPNAGWATTPMPWPAREGRDPAHAGGPPPPAVMPVFTSSKISIVPYLRDLAHRLQEPGFGRQMRVLQTRLRECGKSPPPACVECVRLLYGALGVGTRRG